MLSLHVWPSGLVCWRKLDTHVFNTYKPPRVGIWVFDQLRLPPRLNYPHVIISNHCKWQPDGTEILIPHHIHREKWVILFSSFKIFTHLIHWTLHLGASASAQAPATPLTQISKSLKGVSMLSHSKHGWGEAGGLQGSRGQEEWPGLPCRSVSSVS